MSRIADKFKGGQGNVENVATKEDAEVNAAATVEECGDRDGKVMPCDSKLKNQYVDDTEAVFFSLLSIFIVVNPSNGLKIPIQHA